MDPNGWGIEKVSADNLIKRNNNGKNKKKTECLTDFINDFVESVDRHFIGYMGRIFHNTKSEKLGREHLSLIFSPYNRPEFFR